MERLLKWLDDLDDLLVVLHVQTKPVVVTALLLVAFLAVLGVVFVFGPPTLHAAP
jgi:hypothetical protein